MHGRDDDLGPLTAGELARLHGPESAVVDVGWVGRTSVSLDRSMRQAGLPPVGAWFYVGLSDRDGSWSTEDVRRRQSAFLVDHMARRGLPGEASGTVALVKAFCSGSHGSVAGYRREAGRVVPELVRPLNDHVLDWGLDALGSTVADVVTKLVEDVPDLHRPGDLRGAIDAVLRAFWTDPSPGEVRVWGAFPADSDEAHRLAVPLAAPVRTAAVVSQRPARRTPRAPAAHFVAGRDGRAVSGSVAPGPAARRRARTARRATVSHPAPPPARGRAAAHALRRTASSPAPVSRLRATRSTEPASAPVLCGADPAPSAAQQTG